MSDGINKYALVGDKAVLYQYEGDINKQVLLEILSSLEGILDQLKVDRQVKRKIVNIAIETLQNLQLHSFNETTVGGQSFPPLFLLCKNSASISIVIGNLVDNTELPVLEDKLRKINSLNEEEIKYLYGVIMKQTVVKFSTKGGAGLGLIDMKKKSGNDLDFGFQRINDALSYFNLKVTVTCRMS